jgi:riboflavin synthase
MILNLERSMPAQGRFEGHIVQGHVDCVSTMIAAKEGIFSFNYPGQYAKLLAEKGSVCINGVSLTVVNIRDNVFSVALIPYTLEKTNLGRLKPGITVNIEFDILAKHLVRIIELRG